MLLNDKVSFRMQWPQYADLQVNGTVDNVKSVMWLKVFEKTKKINIFHIFVNTVIPSCKFCIQSSFSFLINKNTKY